MKANVVLGFSLDRDGLAESHTHRTYGQRPRCSLACFRSSLILMVWGLNPESSALIDPNDETLDQ